MKQSTSKTESVKEGAPDQHTAYIDDQIRGKFRVVCLCGWRSEWIGGTNGRAYAEQAREIHRNGR